MQLIDFMDACNIGSKNDIEIFELLCFYLNKEKGDISFSAKKMLHMYGDIGIRAPDVSALKKEAIQCGSFRPFGIEGTLRFTKDRIRSLEKTYGHLWSNVTVSGAAVQTAIAVRLDDFAKACDIGSKSETEILELLCYYSVKEKGGTSFFIRGVADLYGDLDLEVPKISSLEKLARKHPSFRTAAIDGSMEFNASVLRSLDASYGNIWIKAESAPVRSAPTGCEVLDEARFLGKQDGSDKLVIQINSAYREGAFDSCALVMRRLLEATLTRALRSLNVNVTNDEGYLCLDELVKRAGGPEFTRIWEDLYDASKIGDYSEHGPAYTFGADDINSVRTVYRKVLETLFSMS